MRVAIAQIGSVVLDRAATLEKAAASVREAARDGAELVCFGEAVVPGYPFWLSRVDAARFEEPELKELHGLYVSQGVDLDAGELEPVQAAARESGASVVIGVMERAADRGGHSLYCTAVFVRGDGTIGSAHRKLMPTYEERLSWAIGDGHGLRAHRVGGFTVGALNCWENWMPLARAAMYAQGVNLHVAIWPGAVRNTVDLTRHIAREGRCFVISACGIVRETDVPTGVPMRGRMVSAGETVHDGGSCVAGPDGAWIIEPVADREGILFADLDLSRVLAERQSFDPAGHYARPDVLRLVVDRRRQTAAEFIEGGEDGGGLVGGLVGGS